MATRPMKHEHEARVQTVADMLATGSRRSSILQFAADTWGVSVRTADTYIAHARALIRSDWDSVARDQMAAEILSRYATLEQKARETDQLHVALGAIHGAARLAKLIS